MGGGASVIAIDGPVAAGKTVVGRELAQRLGFKFLDTGVMYRAITWLALWRGIPVDDEDALGSLAENHPIRLVGRDSDQVRVGEHLVGAELRESQVNSQVSLVSRLPAVRRELVRQQRILAAEGNMVMMGRDIGTVVLPEAPLKIFLSASLESRAGRRWREMQDHGQHVDFQQVLEETSARDTIDSQRSDSPLVPARDAFLLDTEDLSIDQVADRIMERIRDLAKAQ